MQGESLVRPSDDASIGPLGKGVLPGIRVTSSAQFLVPLSLVQYLGGQDCKDNDFVEDSTVFPFFLFLSAPSFCVNGSFRVFHYENIVLFGLPVMTLLWLFVFFLSLTRVMVP